MIEGKNISHYEVTGKLGEGGMGVVYKAWDRKLARPVALKFLPGHLAGSQEQVARFHQEARAISALNHPNIATIYEIDEQDGQSFLVLEYLPGGTLKSALEQMKTAGQRISIEQGLDYSIEIADALAHAHAHGVIHRDIKSANVLFTESRSLKITDFGLAKLAESAAVTQTGSVLGTPATMSPEQAQGLETDQRSDIFSAGVVMFELFAGELPFRGANPVAMLHQVVYAPAPPLGQVREGTPAALEGIVAKALEKDREARYQSAAELAADLRALRRELMFGNSRDRSAMETLALAPAPIRRRRGRTIGIAAACLAVGLAVWLGWTTVRERGLPVLSLRGRSLPAEKRIAVLPFRTGDPVNQAFADGLNDMVSYKLARLEQFQGSLLVVPAAQINDKDKGAKTAAAARANFGANLAIDGTVLRTGDRLQAVISLVDTGSLASLRSATVETRSSEITTFRDRVMNTVTQMLDLEVTSQALKALQAGDTSDATAYSSYLEGRGYMQRSDRMENLDKAAAAFKQALVKDAKYALAYAGVAEALLKKYDSTKDPSDMSTAEANGARAIDLNDELEPVHITMGRIQLARGLWEQAEAQFRRVLALNPVNPDAYRGLADTYGSSARPKEAEETYKSAIALRPNDWTGHNLLGIFYFRHQRYAEAVPYFQKVAALIPDNVLAFNNLGATELEMGNAPEAIAMYEKSLKLEESALAYSNLGMAYYFARRYPEAAEELEKATRLAPDRESYWGNLGHARRWDPKLAPMAPEAYRRAIELGEQTLGINPRDARVRARLATYWAALGEKQKSLEEIDGALKIDRSGFVQYRAALVWEQAGFRDRALRAVQSAVELGYSLMEIQNAVPLKALRDDARYRKLLDQRTSPPTSGSSKQ